MIYASKRGTLSRQMGVYVQANTGNQTGWRPLYTPLGEMQAQPDWKSVANARERQMHTRHRVNEAVERAKARHMARVDAHARGDRGMSGMGLLDNNSQMTQGANYVFYFNPASGFGINPSPDLIASALAGDSNFGTAVPFNTGTQIAVSFVYKGMGSTVLNAGAEMEKVINDRALTDNSFFAAKVQFAGADGGATASAPQVTDIPAAVQNAANQPSSSGSPFNFLTGISAGTALAIGGIALVMLLKN